MRFTARCIVVLWLMAAAVAAAQEWELGVSGGFGFLRNPAVTTAAGSGTAGFKDGLAFGAVAGNDMYDHLSGEMRYQYRFSNLKVTGGGQQAGFNGETHVIHYDLLFHTAPREARVRPFLAGGGGIKVYRGTGTEAAYQPASKFALLTKTQELRPLISLGGGTKVALTDSLVLRMEFRDYITPFPSQVVTPAPGARIQGWLHDLVPTVGISIRF
jgi:hypothetical protein